MSTLLRTLFVALAIALAAGIGYLWWSKRQPPAPVAEPVAAAPELPAPSAPVASAPAPVIAHPIDAAPAASAPARAEAQAGSGDPVADALVALLGRDKVLGMLNADDFVRRVVATVDNLARDHAPVLMWPVHPTPGRFAIAESPQGTVAAQDNTARYDAFMAFLSQVDIDRAAALYVRLYPRFQKAYEDLGYPNRYFNDRLIEVIDHLLTAPDAPVPMTLVLTEVKGPYPSTQPWTRYQFADPALESQSAGRKIMMRVGPVHARTLKAMLVQWRARLASAPARR